jgi:hypothetical protein
MFSAPSSIIWDTYVKDVVLKNKKPKKKVKKEVTKGK